MTSQTLRTIISLLESTETHGFYRREYGYKIRDGESKFWETSETYTVRIFVRHKHTDNDTRGTCTFLTLCTYFWNMFLWTWCLLKHVLVSISFVLEKTHSTDSYFPAWERKSKWSRGIYLLEEQNSCWCVWTIFVGLNPIFYLLFL